MGLIFLKLWTRIVLFGPIDDEFGPVEEAIVDDVDDVHAEHYWQREFELVPSHRHACLLFSFVNADRWSPQIREGGLKNFRLRRCFRQIIIPIMYRLLTALAVPYVATKGVISACGASPLVVSACYRYRCVAA